MSVYQASLSFFLSPHITNCGTTATDACDMGSDKIEREGNAITDANFNTSDEIKGSQCNTAS